MKRVITVQHCQAVHHVNKMVGGVTDWELTEIGLEQAKLYIDWSDEILKDLEVEN